MHQDAKHTRKELEKVKLCYVCTIEQHQYAKTKDLSKKLFALKALLNLFGDMVLF